MAKYKSNTITIEAQKLINKAIAGISEVQFTRIAFGDGVYKPEDNVSSLTSLKNEKQSISISSLSIVDSKTVCIEGILSNVKLKTGYRITEIGLFAKDKKNSTGQEVLYSIAVADEEYADYLPAYNNYAPVKVLQSFYVAVADSSSTTIAVDSNVSVSKAYLETNYYNKTDTDEAIKQYVSEYATPTSSFAYDKSPKDNSVKLFTTSGAVSDNADSYLQTEKTSEKIIVFTDDTVVLRTVYGSSEPYQILYCLKSKKLYYRIARYVGGHGTGHYVFDNWEGVVYG